VTSFQSSVTDSITPPPLAEEETPITKHVTVFKWAKIWPQVSTGGEIKTVLAKARSNLPVATSRPILILN
jgi:hypothetical protein